MSKLIVVNYLSLDGRFDYGDWIEPYLDATVRRAMADATVQADGMLLGRRTYEQFAAIWPHADESEPAVAAMNKMRKYVTSSTLRPSDVRWVNTVVLQATDIPALKAQQHDGYLVTFGSGDLLRTLIALDLIDEYRLLVLPTIRGTGKRLFDDSTAGTAGAPGTNLHLTGATRTESGVLIATYQRDARGYGA